MRELLISLGLLLREFQGGLRLLDLRLIDADLRLLDARQGIDVFDAGRCVVDLRLRLLERDAVVASLDLRDHVAGVDVLVVGHRHGGDIAGDLRRYGKRPRRDEGVVSRHEASGVVPIQIAGRCRCNYGFGGRLPLDGRGKHAAEVCCRFLAPDADRIRTAI